MASFAIKLANKVKKIGIANFGRHLYRYFSGTNAFLAFWLKFTEMNRQIVQVTKLTLFATEASIYVRGTWDKVTVSLILR